MTRGACRRSGGSDGTGAARRRRAAGFTLIELGAVMAIVMVLIVAGVATLQNVRKADISTSAAKLSTAIRYLYDLAAVNNRTYRLVIDLETRTYWGERIDAANLCDAAVLPSDEERQFGVRDRDEDEEAEAAARDGEPAGAEVEEDAPGALGPDGKPKPRVKDNLLTPRELPKGIRFLGVMTSHQDERTEEGQAEVYFFPSGYVERAFIYLERDTEVYTVETLPLRGVGVIHSSELDPRDLLDEG